MTAINSRWHRRCAWTFSVIIVCLAHRTRGRRLNSYCRFGIPAFTSVVLNLTAIVFAFGSRPNTDNPGVTLAIGVFVAGIIQLVDKIPSMLKLGLCDDRDLTGTRRRTSYRHVNDSAILGSSMGQISVLLSSSIATLLATGSVTWPVLPDRL